MQRKTIITVFLGLALTLIGCEGGVSEGGGGDGSSSGGTSTSGETGSGSATGTATGPDAAEGDTGIVDGGEGEEDDEWSDDDEDGRLDDYDNCPDTENTDQADRDDDGVGDACDNCPDIPNADQTDSDDDGTGDACTGLADPGGDVDDDGVPNGEDNCPETPNGPDGGDDDQEDADNDGIGDACDNCPEVANTAQEDSDDDGEGDRCEDEYDVDVGGGGSDTDGDGLSDQEEADETSTDPSNPDSDGDGKLDGTEVIVGTDPNSSDQACGESGEEAEEVKKPIDIIFAIDTSGSMSEEIDAVESNINSDFANIIQASGVDYQVIMLANKDEVCIGQPLGSGDCGDGAATDTSVFKHIDAEDGTASEQTMDTFLDYYDSESETYDQYLRQDSIKIFVAISDENEQPSWEGGTRTPSDPEAAAREFDTRLLNKSQTHFGTSSDRNYVYHSIVGLEEKASNPNEAYPPGDPIVSSNCPTSWTSEDYGPVSQWASKITGGLRYPVCRTDNYDAIFNEIADGVVDLSEIACTLEFPDVPDGKFVDEEAVALQWTPQGGDTELLTRVDSETDCSPGHFYVENGAINLCPDDCDTISNSSDGELEIFTDCNNCPDPEPEICGDDSDNDCDGEVDEGCEELCEPEREVCDGEDNDCDDEVDEGCPDCTLDGESCSEDSECCTGNCNDNGVCGAPCRPIGVSCIDNGQCCSDSCTSSGGNLGQCIGG